jgi:glutamate---cysteine ligase / carboxylate-amine ligase
LQEDVLGVYQEVGRVFDESEDLTIGIEEEFQVLDGSSLGLVSRYDELKAEGDASFGRQLVYSELIQSEVEINSDKSATFIEARDDLRVKRIALSKAAQKLGLALCASGVHPFSLWEDQTFIDSPHYRQVVDRLQYVAWTNNTFGMHVHVGVRGAERAIKVHDAYRSYLPLLLALSSSSPFFRGRETGLHSTRAQVFVRAFPRCGVPDAYGSWRAYADYAQMLFETGSVSEPTQIWWTLRPHHRYGTLEIRAPDAQPDFGESMALAALAVGLAADLLDRYDAGEPLVSHENRLLEENRWRALRFGLEGRLIDLESHREVEAREVVAGLLERCSGVARRLGLQDEFARVGRMLTEGNSSQRQLELRRQGASIEEIHRLMVAETMSSAGC